MTRFSVTYEIVTHESAEAGKAEEQGYIIENVSLRQALDDTGGTRANYEADSYPVTDPRWFTNYEYDRNYRTGAYESRSLHLPESITPASRRRIARLLGVRT